MAGGFETGGGAEQAPAKVIITGGAGQIGYQLGPLVASGQTLGERKINLGLLELPQAQQAAEGVAAELQDGAYKELVGVEIYEDPEEAFDGATHVFMVGAMPRREGMDRSDLLEANAGIFKEQGAALEEADDGVKVLVVGNPANSNALVAATYAPPEISERDHITAMSRLDHNRAVSLAAAELGVPVDSVFDLIIWGNHSNTMVVDTRMAEAGGMPLEEAFGEAQIDLDKYAERITKRGGEILALRGLSSAMSAARAASDHMHDWELGTDTPFTSAAMLSRGEYDLPEGVYASMPVLTEKTLSPIEFTVVRGLTHPYENKAISGGIRATGKELAEERAALQEAGILPK